MQQRAIIQPITVILLGVMVCLTACDGPPAAEKDVAEGAGEVLAVVGDRRLTVDAFQRELNKRAARAPGAFDQEQDRERLLEAMVEREVLLSRAYSEGFDQRPDIVDSIETLIASRYRETHWAQWSTSTEPISSEAITDYYLAHSNMFLMPSAVRAGVLRLDCPAGVPADKRATLVARAEALRLEAADGSEEDYTILVQRHSDDQSSRYTGGDTGWLVAGEGSLRWPEGVVEAAFQLEQEGSVAPLVHTGDALYIVRLSGSRAAARVPLSEVSSQIRYRLERHREASDQQAFNEAMRGELQIEVNTDLVRRLGPTTQVETVSVPALPGP